MDNIDRLCMGCMRETAGGVCPTCGFRPDMENRPPYLPLRTVLLERYVVGRMLTANGEGATYIGYDIVSSAPIRIREFLPDTMFERPKGQTELRVLPPRGLLFSEGAARFTELAKILLRLRDLPGLLPAIDVFEANHTVYYVTENPAYIDLRDFLMRNGGLVDWEHASMMLLPLLPTLSTLHASGVIHRGLSPETILIGRDARARLTGFCIPAARTAHTPFTTQLFPGFAALEQYSANGEQGPWTDVYAFGAVLYRSLVGTPPPEATSRAANDRLLIPPEVAASLSPRVLGALSSALRVIPEDRIRSAELLRERLSLPAAPPPPPARPPIPEPEPEDDDYDEEPESARGRAPREQPPARGRAALYWIITFLIILAVAGAGAALFESGVFSKKPAASSSSSSEISDSSAPSSSSAVSIAPAGPPAPNFVGQTWAQLTASSPTPQGYQIQIAGKQYSSTVPRGIILSQDPAAGAPSPVDEPIKLIISLGPSQVAVPDVTGLSWAEAEIKLLQVGFLPGNIIKMDKYDATRKPGAVLSTLPAAGTKLNPDAVVTVFVNSYTGSSSSGGH